MIASIRKIFSKCYISLFLLAGMGMLACNKQVDPLPVPPSGNVFFYNGSLALLGEALRGHTNYILVDSRDSTYRMDSIQISKYPYFNSRYINSCPDITLQWPGYWKVDAGKHTLNLVDTGGFIINTSQITVEEAHPSTVIYADSCGDFRSLVLTDNFTPVAGQVGVRLINMSPADGQLFITINKNIPAELPASTHYGDHTVFVPFNLSQPGNFTVKVFSVSDSTQELSRVTVGVIPGHAYTLLLTGYPENRPASYIDPRTGGTVSLQTNFAVTALKNF